jgi:hypothetical protein
VGLLLVIVPWSSFWDRNLLLEAWPVVFELTRSAFVRGAVSGLGVLNLAAGAMEVAMAWRLRRAPAGSPLAQGRA